MMLDENFPYGMVSRGQQHNQFSVQMLIAAYKAGDSALAQKIYSSLKKDLDQQHDYLDALPDSKRDVMQSEVAGVERLRQGLPQIKKEFENPQLKMMPPTDAPPPIKVAPLKGADTQAGKKGKR